MDLITLSAAKERFGLTSSSLANLKKQGKIAYYRRNGELLVDVDQLRKLVKVAPLRGEYFLARLALNQEARRQC